MRAVVLRVRSAPRDRRPPRIAAAGASARRRAQAWYRGRDTPPPYRQRLAVRRSHTVRVSCQRLGPSARNYSPKNAAFTLTSNGLRVPLIGYSRWSWWKIQFVYRRNIRSHIAPLGWITPESSANPKLEWIPR